MRRICEDCKDSFDDEFYSTVCPHSGLGFCRKCDLFDCVCVKHEKETFDFLSYREFMHYQNLMISQKEFERPGHEGKWCVVGVLGHWNPPDVRLTATLIKLDLVK